MSESESAPSRIRVAGAVARRFVQDTMEALALGAIAVLLGVFAIAPSTIVAVLFHEYAMANGVLENTENGKTTLQLAAVTIMVCGAAIWLMFLVWLDNTWHEERDRLAGDPE